MKIPNFIGRMIGTRIAKKLDLGETTMDEKKPWYKSKTILTGVVTVLVAAYNTAHVQFNLPAIPEFVFAILGAIGVYSRTVATEKIG